jgi:UDP-glucose:(heptosyl)LPS alpha-1,3-glucosyltransferase
LYLQYENEVFGDRRKTKILSITDKEQQQFARYYSTQSGRFYKLPPGISPTQFECKNPRLAREKIRAESRIPNNAKVILCLGSGFKTKGLDRSLNAFALLQARLSDPSFLLIVGADKPDRYLRQAQQLGISSHIKFLGGRNDVADILQASDLLLHPAYRELAGNVIIEAMLAGKPIVTTDVCGFAHYVTDYNMGAVISAPYELESITAAVEKLLQIAPDVWQARAQQLLTVSDVSSRQTRALDALEEIFLLDQNESSELILEDDQKIIVLRDELIKLWSQKNVFDLVQNLSGSVARELQDRQTLRFDLDNKTYYRKLHRGAGWREIFKNLFQFRLPILGAKNEWLALNKLRALGIPSLEAVAYGEQKTNPAKKLSFIVTRELADVVQLDHYFQEHKVGFKEKSVLLGRVAEIASSIHAAGINHRDFYLCHFMLDGASVTHWRERGADPKIYIVDLHRAQIRQRVPLRWLIKDLSGLYFSSLDLGFTRKDYFRFIRIYWQLSLRDFLVKNESILRAIAKRAIKTYKRDFDVIPKLPISLI